MVLLVMWRVISLCEWRIHPDTGYWCGGAARNRTTIIMAYRVVNLRAAVWSGIKRIMAGHLTLKSVQITPCQQLGIYGTARYSQLSDEVKTPMVDKSWMDCFPPGSLIVSDIGMI